MECRVPTREEVPGDKDRDAGAPNPSVLPFAVVIPARNAGTLVAPLVAALKAQSVRPLEVLVVDSASGDGSPERFRAAGFRVHAIRAADFDHGGTRNLALALIDSRAAAVVFMTQDAIPAAPHAVARLLRPLADPAVAMSYGRQLPRAEAGPIERHARAFNYGAAGMVKRLPEARRLGFKAAFASNSFAAYRRDALEALGGFPEPIIVGEDQVFAANSLLAGWSVAYAADAEVVHSHGYTPVQEFRRYFDIGVAHATYPVIDREFGTAGGEGFAYVRSELAFLVRAAPHLVAVAPIYWAAKLLGYRLGRHAAHLPPGLQRRLSMHKAYFRPARARAVVSASLEAAD
jgi:rhamnosyltransferase